MVASIVVDDGDDVILDCDFVVVQENDCDDVVEIAVVAADDYYHCCDCCLMYGDLNVEWNVGTHDYQNL